MSHKPNYNIVLNSQFCTSATSTNVNTNKEYYVDWSAILPNKKFKLTFSFVSEGSYITTFGLIPLITIDFLNQGHISLCNSSFQATTSTILGLTYPTYLDPNAHIAYFRADKDFNNQIYTPRPFSNNFNVRIITNGNPPGLWVDEAAVPADFPQYVLILSFEEYE